MIAGRLRSSDPAAAAEHYLALLTGLAEARSRFGTRAIFEAEQGDIARAAVSVFLAAYAT